MNAGSKRLRHQDRLRPPDGGWGWVVTAAAALGNITMIPIIQNFGLVYRERFKQLGMSGTDRAVVINTNSSFGMLMGLANGVMLNRYGYRKCASAGGLLVSGGLFAAAFSDTFGQLLASYGFVTSLGFGLAMAAFSLATHSYFAERRSIAVGVSMALTGLGPIFMPLLLSAMLDRYAVRGTLLLLAGMALNILVAAALLQPVRWHMLPAKDRDEERPTLSVGVVAGSTTSVNVDGETVRVYDSPVGGNENEDEDEDEDEHVNKRGPCSRLLDLELLKDPGYVNLLVGLSLAICAEMNFSLITPFLLDDYGYDVRETAQVLSVVAFTDVIFRFVSPFVAHRLGSSCRSMYLGSLVLLIVTRSALLFVRTFGQLMTVAVFLGIAKGFRTVFMNLLVPNYVPIEKLANATGMQFVLNGAIIIIAGSSMGLIRDMTGTYDNTVVVINLITSSTIVMWCAEDLYKWSKKGKGKGKGNANANVNVNVNVNVNGNEN